MSDDEEYYEWEEEYLIEDVPDFVDELAQTSYYEAALYEDPGIEAEDYTSDWEYYTDDYYDEDPTVKPAPVAKDTDTKTRRANRAPRLKSSIKPDITTFQGVVWKTSSLEKDQDVAIQIYEPGAGEQVALLKNWREVFKYAQPALDKSRLRKRKAESVCGPEPVLADDEFPCDNDRDDSSNQMSDIVSMDHTTENGDAGDASNTTPEPPQPLKRESNLAVVIPAKKGRKRKAEVLPETTEKSVETTPRAKRIASKKRDVDSGTKASSGPVRRSTRQKK
ncbi:uncharacterized protein N7477_007979 [Penicillium maclennaniae]|uniref:uncharacterized protein n=1 Tax=Penicillium maclennaniae TaxID=1343394 RepID=UPI00254187C1|nr:uncharacterized protein N7477_007979 [Penicillium maclennaniae]KAJ5665531.1 hypothetical protein N7477_007979 [Penicillium maclennaniae]